MNRSRKIVRGQAVQPEKLLLAKQLRREMTLAEQRLWKALRRNAADRFHFRRFKPDIRYPAQILLLVLG